MKTLVLVRHGESTWNKENRFTGWTDVPLSPRGIEEAREAGRTLVQEGFSFDVAFTSVLKRAITTLWYVIDEMDLVWLPVYKTWRLNERHYGALQGLNKRETVELHGEEQVKLWRRSYNITPPPLDSADPRNPARDRRYAFLRPEEIPLTECLKDTVARVLPYWHDHIAQALLQNKRVLVVSHGNSLRALVKYLDKISDEDISELNIPTGLPLVYKLNDDLSPMSSSYLADQEYVEMAARAVAEQTRK